jgi:hypothetical protein
MAIAYVQNTTNGSAQPQLTGVAGTDFLTLSLFYILNASGSAADTPSIVDSTLQPWNPDNVPVPQGRTGDWVGVANFSLPNANSGTHTITVSYGEAVLVTGYAMAEWSGMALTAGLDQTGLTGGTTFGNTGMTVTANANTAQASELVIVAMAIETNAAASAAITDPPTGFISLALNNTWQSSNFGYESAYQIRSSIGRPSAAWSWTGTGTNTYQSVMSTYPAAAVASKSGLMLSLMGVG